MRCIYWIYHWHRDIKPWLSPCYPSIPTYIYGICLEDITPA